MIIAIVGKGFLSGLIITGGIGPIGILCIRRSLQQGIWGGLSTGLGAALADAAYCIIGFLSVNLLYDYLIDHTIHIRAMSGLLFILLGIKILFTSDKQNTSINKSNGLISNFISGALITFANPGTLIAFMAIITSLGLSKLPANFLNTFLIGTSVFTGSFIWWILLSASSNYLRTKINDKSIKIFNNICGIGLIIFGTGMLYATMITHFLN